MVRSLSLLLLISFSFLLNSAFAQEEVRSLMDNSRMAELMEKEAGNIEGALGAWQLTYGDRPLFILTDEEANRMRIFTPVLDQKEINADHYQKMLEANFHSALDAKYSIYNGFVVAVFTHPLKELTDDQLISAMRQVVSLANTFGTTYQSMEFIFGGGIEEEDKKVNEKPSGKSQP